MRRRETEAYVNYAAFQSIISVNSALPIRISHEDVWPIEEQHGLLAELKNMSYHDLRLRL